jgi:Immunoglobulin V-set domain
VTVILKLTLSECLVNCVSSGWRVLSEVLQTDVIVVEKETVHLLCATTFNDSVWWTVRTILHGDRDRRPIYRNRGLVNTFKQAGRYIVTYSEGVYNLTVINTTVADAGEYQCIEEEGMGTFSSLSLKVFGMIWELF